MSDIRAYLPYTTVDRVTAELPRFDRDRDLSDEQILQFVETQANEIDGRMVRYYRVPARRLDANGHIQDDLSKPGWMPSQFERLNRLLAANDCMTMLRDMRQDEQSIKTRFAEDAEKLMEAITSGDVIVQYPFQHEDGRPYFLRLAAGSPIYGKHPLSAGTRVSFVYPRQSYDDYDPTAPTSLNRGPLRRGGR